MAAYRRRYRYARRSAGNEAALQHIEEARKLSVELGGTDEDVKKYFFHLRREEMKPILDAYEANFGANAREYAEETLPRWRSGNRKMSGLVASRLFSLLPSFMPVSKKFELVKSLWETKCPSSSKTFYVGVDANEMDICNQVRQHLETVVQNYTIPESITRRFQWLAQNDVDLQQQLYNYFLQLNREAVSDAAENRIPTLLSHMRQANGFHQNITQNVNVGNHEVKLEFHQTASGISTERPRQTVQAHGDRWGCLVVLGIVIFLVALAYVQ